jgi:predicted ATPase
MKERLEHSLKTSPLPLQPTSFVGRDSEIAEVGKLLTDPACRLLTLFGPGGVGKTRLAIECAALQQNTFPDGVYFVPLAQLKSANEIPHLLAQILSCQLHNYGDSAREILSHLQNKQVLLVMDNFEHLLDGVGLVTRMLEHATSLKILTTSREVLNLQEEWAWNVPGISGYTNQGEGLRRAGHAARPGPCVGKAHARTLLKTELSRTAGAKRQT